jgi:two-component system KDP operon response regulator KdpE
LTSPSILLVEDDPAVLHMLQATMEYGGFKSEPASSASEALACLDRDRFDSILLDLKLPDADGERLIQEIRHRSDAPILVVSGFSSERNKIEALDAGADDFIPKPFLPGELLARLRAALRRWSPTDDTSGDIREERIQREPEFSTSFTTHRSVREGSMEDRLLTFLKAHHGVLVTSDQIVDAVWGREKPRGEKNVRVLIATLRRKLKARGEPIEIVNEHGRGYRLRRAEDFLRR